MKQFHTKSNYQKYLKELGIKKAVKPSTKQVTNLKQLKLEELANLYYCNVRV